MIAPTSSTQVLVTTKLVDFSKGMKGLAALVCAIVQADPLSSWLQRPYSSPAPILTCHARCR
jgi:hypothetical protein